MSIDAETYDDEIQRFLSELPQNDAFVRVMRVEPITGKLRLCRGGRLDLSSYSPDMVEAKWGGGEFKIEVFDGKSSGARRRIPLFIEGEPKHLTEDARDPNQNQVAAYVPAPASTSSADLAIAISQAMTQSMAPVLASLERVVQSLAVRPAQAPSTQPSLLDLTEALRNLQDISRPPVATAAPGGMSPGISQIKELLELAREISGTSENDPGPLDLLNKAIDKIGTPLIDMLRASSNAGPGLPATVTKLGNSAMPQQNTNSALQSYANMLYNSFKQDEPPDNWVGLILDRVPDEWLNVLLPDPVPELSKVDPRCAVEPFSTWLRELGKQCHEALNNHDDDPPATT